MKDRLLVPELMDDPNLDPALHESALTGLRRLNWISASGYHIAKAIEEQARRRGLTSFSILDVGCGSGDVARSVQNRLSKSFDCKTEGWDISPVAVATATELTKKCQVRFSHQNILDVDMANEFDFVYCSLFLHHFSEKQAIAILKSMRQIASRVVLIDDLKRSRWGWLLAVVGCHALTRSPIVHFDGPQSVRAAFAKEELVGLLQEAGYESSKILTHWPERWLVVESIGID